MTRNFSTVIGVLILAIVFATSAVSAENSPWSEQAELSYVNTSGNSEVTTLSGKNTLGYQFSEKISGQWKLEFLNGESDGERTAESYFTELRADYDYTKRLYYYSSASWLKDRFAGIDSRTVIGGGAGYKILTGAKHFLKTEAGLNYTIENPDEGAVDKYPGGRLFGSYEYHFSEKNRFTQSLEAVFDFSQADNYLLNSETAIISSLNSVLSLKTSYVVKYDNQPVADAETTDRTLGVTLVVNY